MEILPKKKIDWDSKTYEITRIQQEKSRFHFRFFSEKEQQIKETL